jgi:hypothetical protein
VMWKSVWIKESSVGKLRVSSRALKSSLNFEISSSDFLLQYPFDISNLF